MATENLNLMLQSLRKGALRPTFNARGVLVAVGLLVALCGLFNASLVYDDIAFDLSFPVAVQSYGWFRAAFKIFVLDLPNEYRTYGLSRTFQFFIWSLGGGSVKVYAAIISAFHLATVLALHALLTRLGFAALDALLLGLMWLLSPFIGTSCFHHFSYLILPISIAIIGSYVLFFVPGFNQGRMAVLLGVALALTGELHLLTGGAVVLLVARGTHHAPTMRRAAQVVVTMVVALVAHYLVWKTFAAEQTGGHRFTLNLLHGLDYWAYRFWVATRGIGWSVSEQLDELIGGEYAYVASIACFASFPFYFMLRRIANQGACAHGVAARRSSVSLAAMLIGLSCLYLTTFVVIVSLTDTVPSTMPRRYGYVPLTVLAAGLTLLLSESFPQRRQNKWLVMGVLLGCMAALFVRYQFSVLPTTKRMDEALAKAIIHELKVASADGVLLFHADQDLFTPIAMDGATPGPMRRGVISAEVSQAKFGTFLPTFLELKSGGASFVCYLRTISADGSIAPECPPRHDDPGVIRPDQAIIVANLGSEKDDPSGKNVRIFKNFSEFEQFFFTKTVVKGIDWKVVSADALAIDLGATAVAANIDNVYPDKSFNDPVKTNWKPWLLNYGFQAGMDGKYLNSVIGVNSDYYRTNRYGDFEYGLDFQKSNVVIGLDFWELWGRKPGERVFQIQVSWNGGAWVSLGTVDPARINDGMPFSMRLAHQGTQSFRFKLINAPGSLDVPFIQGLRVYRLP